MRSIAPAIACTFLVAAAWMSLADSSGVPEVPPPVTLAPGAIDTSPRREVFASPPTIKVAGFDQRCSECHRLFESRSQTPANLLRHEEIVLEHGLNNRCLNCHSQRDRDKLILHGEVEIGYDQVVDLCAKCHGPTWRDWQKGMHGRTQGSWDSESPEQTRLMCTQCHDPHAPAYTRFEPLPGPRTLRLGERKPIEHVTDGAKASPLLRWMRSSEHAAEPGEDEVLEPGEGEAIEPGEGEVLEPGEGEAIEPGEGEVLEPGEGDETGPDQNESEEGQ